MAYRNQHRLRGARYRRPTHFGAREGAYQSDPGDSGMGRTMADDASSSSPVTERSFEEVAEERPTRHPPGLRGRQIGIWYAQNSSRKRGNKERRGEARQRIHLDEQKAVEIEALLSTNKVMDVEGASASATSEQACAEDTSKPSISSISTKFEYIYMQHKLETRLKEQGKVDAAPEPIALVRDQALDVRYRKLLEGKRQSARYLKMLNDRQHLPAYKMSKELLRVIQANQVIVISGETGCGKTTQVPQYILDDSIQNGVGSQCHIICTQPRRISAISVAERVADERDEACGGASVGFQIRLDSKLPRPQGSILFCTTGTVLKYLEPDPLLMRASHVIIDEIHERDLQSDFLLIIMKSILERRPDLKLILMSATLNAEKFSKFYGNCPMLNIPGFTYPVEEYYLEDALEHARYTVAASTKKKFQSRREIEKEDKEKEYEALKPAFLRTLPGKYSQRTIESVKNYSDDIIDLYLVKALIEFICRQRPEGAILVFLPGWDNISKLNGILMEDGYFGSGLHKILPLHSMLPTLNQREVFSRPPRGVRKIILSTNIAETSVTIDDIVYVIDCGKIKITTFEVKDNISTLAPEWVSLANAHQRRGRAGRVQPGICYHLYTKLRENLLEAYLLPEMLRTRLEELCLHIKMLKLGKIEPFLSKAMDPPSPEALKLSLNMLTAMNALDSDENLTPLGYHLARLPVDPRMGKMLLFGAIFSCLSPILTVAASLNFKDAFVLPLGKERLADEQRYRLSEYSKSDHITLVNAYEGWAKVKGTSGEQHYCFQNFLSGNTLGMLHKMRGQLAEHLHAVKLIDSPRPTDPDSNRNSDNVKLVKAVLCAGLYPNVAKAKTAHQKPDAPRKKHYFSTNTAHTKEDGHVKLHFKSVNALEGYFESPWLVYHTKMKSNNEISLHDTTMVPAYPLIFFGGNIKSDDNSDTIVVDDFIKFHCTKKTADLIKKLRKELDELLELKICRPGCTNWDSSTSEGALLKAIVELIQSEEILNEISYDEQETKEKVRRFSKKRPWQT